MRNQKELERKELHRTIWNIANELRGSIDGWDFKQYVLGLLFYRFISENLTNYINANERKAGYKTFDYAKLDDQSALEDKGNIVKEKGFFILPSELFSNVASRATSNEDLNITLENVFKDIEGSATGTNSEANFKGLFDDLDVNSRKLGGTVEERNERLAKLLKAISALDFGNYNEGTIDLFGDAYEYLMTMYAANAGKSGGEFFTPQEVSELLAKIAIIDFTTEDKKNKETVNKVYDPACGSGSLLLQFAKVLGKNKIQDGFFGQEINLTTYNLARINMFLHDIPFDKFSFAYGDTLKDPKHKLDRPFDAIVSNPPYSIKWDGKSNPLYANDDRFSPAGVLAPEGKADLAFIMHILYHLSNSGTAAIVEFPGVLYRGSTEQKIRQYLIDHNFIDSVIQLPSDLFFGSTISTVILVLRKNKTDNNVLFIDASNEFTRHEIKNKLSDNNISVVLETVKNRTSKDHFSRFVSHEEIKNNKYNLSPSTYIEGADTREKVDIQILNGEIKDIVQKQMKLRASLDKIIAQIEGDGVE